MSKTRSKCPALFLSKEDKARKSGALDISTLPLIQDLFTKNGDKILMGFR